MDNYYKNFLFWSDFKVELYKDLRGGLFFITQERTHDLYM